MIQSQKLIKPDLIGVVAGSLCLIHCVITPFLFIAKVCSVSSCIETPIWWQAIDYVFILISFVAIYHATKKSTKKWIQNMLWVSWVLLLFAILNESFEVVLLPEIFIYFPALAIVGFHIYNYKYCKCEENSCCVLK